MLPVGYLAEIRLKLCANFYGKSVPLEQRGEGGYECHGTEQVTMPNLLLMEQDP